MGTITTVTTVIKNPSPKMLDLVERMREHKRKMREENRQLKPLYTIKGWDTRPIYMHLIGRAEHKHFIEKVKEYIITNYGK